MSETQPLNVHREVKTILISQPQPSGKSPYLDLSEKYNLKIDFYQFIQVEGVTAKEFRREKANPADFTAIIFNSRTAIEHFFRLCGEMRATISPDMKYFCSSEAIALYLQKFIDYRKRKVFYNKNNKSDLYSLLEKHKAKEKFLYPCADIRSNDVPDFLQENNFNYSEAVIYHIVSSDLSDLKDIYYDIIVFFTPLEIKSLYDNFPDFEQKNTRIACWGQSAAQALLDHGLRIDIHAPSPELPSMTMALEDYVQKVNIKEEV
ncbi:MAG: uroporphyrinogen-III synthase [Chitinophagales bacterium]|nr:uroporphyrinogen-III synthase [Bacteroidota bacterium]MCB9043556.1 uroporphyrinogen-III synthase [Chitinophagales bacterium]